MQQCTTLPRNDDHDVPWNKNRMCQNPTPQLLAHLLLLAGYEQVIYVMVHLLTTCQQKIIFEHD